MNDIVWYLVGFLALIVLAGLVAGLVSNRSATRSAPGSAVPAQEQQLPGQENTFPYEKEGYLLSRAERSFYEVLRRAAGDDLQVFAKVRLADVVKVRPGTASWQSHQNRIDRKHVDFVLCDAKWLSPVMVVELDDASHQRSDRQARDSVVDNVLASAGLPLLRVRAANSYNMNELAARIQAGLPVVSAP